VVRTAMKVDPRDELTEILAGLDRDAANRSNSTADLFPRVYKELRRLAAAYLKREPAGQTLQATALVHEAYLRMVNQTRVAWRGRTHFFAVAATAMRRILCDHARARLRDKRGGAQERVTFVEGVIPDARNDYALEDLIAIDEALDKLATLDRRQARLVEQRFFGGLSLEEAAAELGISKRTAEGDWTHAKAWLSRELAEFRAP
jgi:RNA polymerase sigma factor (TIGR02999 family)